MTRIEEIEAREAKATKGPWAVESCGEKGDGSNMIGVMYAPEDLDCNSPLSGWPPECIPITGEFVEYYRDELVAECEHRNRNAFHDADFISHAREDIPYLLSEVKRMREALEWLPIEQAPDGVPVRVRQGDWYGTARFNRRHAVGHWTDGASILHYNGTVLVSSFRFSPGAEFQHITPPVPHSKEPSHDQ